MTLESPTLLDFLCVCARLRGDNVDEYLASTFNDRYDPDVAAMEFASREGPKFVYRAPDGQPVCIGGFRSVSPGVMEAWMICAPDWDQHWRGITKHARGLIRLLLENGSIHRIEHRCMASRVDAMRWYRVLGLNQERIARSSGKHGQDMADFARVRGD